MPTVLFSFNIKFTVTLGIISPFFITGDMYFNFFQKQYFYSSLPLPLETSNLILLYNKESGLLMNPLALIFLYQLAYSFFIDFFLYTCILCFKKHS